MPERRTIRGAARTPLERDCDVLVCGASFAGLAVARRLTGSGARVLVVDRYEIGERQTSACAAPTEWLRALGLEGSIRQTFGELTVNTPHATARMSLPFTFSTFDYPELCSELFEQGDAEFEIAKVESPPAASSARPPGAAGAHAVHSVHTDRGVLRAPLVVDALGWRRVLAGGGNGFQPPDAPLSRGLEVHPRGASDELAIWIDRGYVPAGYGWSFPADGEVRVGVGSFDPRRHVKEPTVRLARDLEREPVRYQGNWIPHRLRPAAQDGVFFAGDSAGHCLPLTAEGIRTAFYFGLACGGELRAVVEGRRDREAALRRYAAFSASHRWKFEAMLRAQRLVPRIPPRLLALTLRGVSRDRFVNWSFGHYLRIAPPGYARRALGSLAPAARKPFPRRGDALQLGLATERRAQL
jgi:flavin-dependent dehydrogenase